MKVLWFEVSTPVAYDGTGGVRAGWQDSLERILKTCDDIELHVSFEAKIADCKEKIVDGVHYHPLKFNYSLIERIKNRWTWEYYVRELDKETQRVVNEVKPDVIHVFGTEWLFGRIAKYTDIPVVVHIMGAIIPYNNALYAPGYTSRDYLKQLSFFQIKKRVEYLLLEKKKLSWSKYEREVWHNVSLYMGRTEWDKALSSVLHPGRKYFHVEEALRTAFVSDNIKAHKGTYRLVLTTIGNSSFWKGPDMALKTASILCDLGIDFEWYYVGAFDSVVKKMIEKKEGCDFSRCHLHLTGAMKPEALSELLSKTTIYVHTAYIENSPNSICEAQCLGLPIVSTNVGGISTLVREHVDGVLVPANDPWQMANAILDMAKNDELRQQLAKSGQQYALVRHNDTNIKNQLQDCYSSIIKETRC